MIETSDIVGYREIISRTEQDFGQVIPLDTVRGWEKYRRAWVDKGRPVRSASRPRDIPMPDPIAQVNGTPAYSWPEIRDWLTASGKVEPKD